MSLIIKRITNQNYSETSPYTIRMISVKKEEEKKKCWPGCAEIGTHMHCWEERKVGQPLRKQDGNSSKELKLNNSVIQELPWWLRQ